MARMSKLSKDDEKDDEAGNPGVSLVGMDNLISKKSDQESGSGNDDNAGPSWHVAIDGIEELSSYNYVD